MQAVVIYLVSFIMLSILEFNTGSEVNREPVSYTHLENLGYQRDEFVKTPIICSTLANGYELTVSAREGKGYTGLSLIHIL